jgi:imidazolonepropionase-like amidohydrolase
MPRIHVTFLAAHAVPPEYFGRRHDYVDAVGTWCADAAAAGADSVDVYCEEGGSPSGRRAGCSAPAVRPGSCPAARVR